MNTGFAEQKGAAASYRGLHYAAWLVYFCSYFLRYDLSAAMVAIGEAEGYSTGQLGLMASLLFISYGMGQFLAGRLGDRLDGRWMVFVGIGGASVCNALMVFSHCVVVMQMLWCANGLLCAMIWAPIVRLLSLYVPEADRRRVLLTFTYSTVFGQAGTYLLASFIVAKWSWRVVFFASAVGGATAAAVWLLSSRRLPKTTHISTRKDATAVQEKRKISVSAADLYIRSGLLMILLTTMLVGLLKDGIMTWVPQMVSDTFGTSAALSVFLSAILPLLSASSVWIVKKIGRFSGNDDMRTCALLFCAAGAGIVLLLLAGRLHPVLTVLLLSAVCTLVSALNSIQTNFVPLQYIRFGHTATVAGVTNGCTYIGSAVSGWGLGVLADRWGWLAAQWALLVLCVTGLALCLIVRPVWRCFVSTPEQMQE